jgi:hypothetical protein
MLKKSCRGSFFILLFWATAAWSSCQEALVPELPSPDWVDEQDVLRAQRAVKQYIQEQEIFLTCTRRASAHNAAVNRMHAVAKKYNEMARRYKARKASMDIMTEFVFYFNESPLLVVN